MRVISLINGSLISEVSTIYALKYAKELGIKVSLVFINRKKDILNKAKKSYKNLKEIAEKLEIEIDFLIFENLKEFKKFVNKKEIDIIFSSTRHKHSILDKSFSKTLIKSDIKADLAIIKVVKLITDVEKIVLPIRDTKLSVKKFSFFITFTKAYNAKSEIYSIKKVTPFHFGKNIKKELQKVIFNFRHYFRIAKMMNIKLSIKYDNAISEADIIKTHIAKDGYDLAIIGANRNKSIFNNHPIYPIFQNPMINTIYFIPYEEEL